MQSTILRFLLAILLFCLFPQCTKAHYETINGTFPSLAHQQVKLLGFDGFSTYTIDSVKSDERGTFTLSFTPKDHGMAYLAAEDNKAFIVILAPGENFMLQGETLAASQSVAITSGRQNQLFEQYSSEHARRDQALSAWDYLEKIYKLDSLFAIHNEPKNAIFSEKQRIKDEDQAFLNSLDHQTYVSWFLPLRKLVSSVSTIAQYRTAEIPGAIAAFRNMDYTDPRLYKSGLLRETIEAHFWLIENSGRSLDSVFIEMNVSIDHMIENLVFDERKFNEITQHLFNLLEQRSLLGASEYLALKILNEVSCTIDYNFANQLESYRAMKVGNIAPDIVFDGDIFNNGQPVTSKARMSEIKAEYIVVVFGSSWCPICPQELSAIKRVYDKWNRYGMEVVYISLDEDRSDFMHSVAEYPFLSYSEFKGWQTSSAKDYHVFATPTLFLLDSNREILLRPHSVRQLDAWVDWVILQGH
jgi:peroxiredoxin